MAYQYSDPPKSLDIVWIKAITEVKWDEHPYKHVFNQGDITWIERKNWNTPHLDGVICPESNRHRANYKKDCFVLIPDPKVTQASKPASTWRIKTADEIKVDGNWNIAADCPSLWHPKMKYLLGIPITMSKYIENCEAGVTLEVPRKGEPGTWSINPRYYTNKPLNPSQYMPASAPQSGKSYWRFKTEEEFRADDNWSGDTPRRWGPIMTSKFLGQLIDKEYWQKCKLGMGFEYKGWTIRSNEYVACDPPKGIVTTVIDAVGYMFKPQQEEVIMSLSKPRAKRQFIVEDMQDIK